MKRISSKKRELSEFHSPLGVFDYAAYRAEAGDATATCANEPSYENAMRLCLAHRRLFLFFRAAWSLDIDSCSKDLEGIRKELAAGTKAVRSALPTLPPECKEHGKRMVENCALRDESLKVLGDVNRTKRERNARVKRMFNDLAEKNGLVSA